MDEHATFETGAVLAPRRARWARLAPLVLVVAFAAIAWAGVSGPPAPSTAARSPGPTIVAVASPRVEEPEPYPAEVRGIAVQRLGELQLGGLALDDVVAIAGWYVPTAINDCPELIALFENLQALCVRSGVLYASRPDNASSGVTVVIVTGVGIPLELRTIGIDPIEVVVVGRFSRLNDGCRTGVACSRQLEVDQVAWTRGAEMR